MKILITGASGFVGSNLIKFFERNSILFETLSVRAGNEIIIRDDITVVIHLAGKAHDLSNTLNGSDYYRANTTLTIEMYQAFSVSNAMDFIYLSSVKAVSDDPTEIINEFAIPNPKTHYGKSKFAAEQYLKENEIPNKRVFILRPCMIHGPKNKGNLNLLFSVVKNGIPYPFGSFFNERSYLSIDNLCFIINELMNNKFLHSDIYMLADDGAISTIDVVKLIGLSLNRPVKILPIPKWLIVPFVKVGNLFDLKLNNDNFKKLTQNYVVSNKKIKLALGKELPFTINEGLMKTFISF